MLGGGDSKPYIRFSPSINSWEMSGAEGREEFTWDAPVVFDVHGLQLGWMKIDSMGREWAPWASRDQRTPQPSEEHKIGFAINVVSSKLFGDEPVREFSANTFGNLMFIQELYNTAEANPEFKSGKVPVVQITGSKAQKIGKGTTRIPEFEIKKWVDRPAELGEVSTEAPVAQPAPQQAPVETAPASDDEF
jgi:hypothetical protein